MKNAYSSKEFKNSNEVISKSEVSLIEPITNTPPKGKRQSPRKNLLSTLAKKNEMKNKIDTDDEYDLKNVKFYYNFLSFYYPPTPRRSG